MLRENWRSTILPYETEDQYRARGGTWGFGFRYYPEKVKPPYAEGAMTQLLGVIANVNASEQMPGGTSAVYVFGVPTASYWPGWSNAYWMWDGQTGIFIRRTSAVGGFTIGFEWHNGVIVSRNGSVWGLHYYSNVLSKLQITTTGVKILEQVSADRFAPTISFFGVVAIDDAKDVFLNVQGQTLHVFELKSGKFKYSIRMPESVVQICLEDDSRCYILMGNRVLVLFDYMRGEVLGAAKVPQLKGGTNYGPDQLWNNVNIRMGYDRIFRRILFAENTPDNPNGSSTIVVRGFSMVNEPYRLTRPIPLKVARVGRTIPVLVQVVDDMNQGVGGYIVSAEVK